MKKILAKNVLTITMIVSTYSLTPGGFATAHATTPAPGEENASTEETSAGPKRGGRFYNRKMLHEMADYWKIVPTTLGAVTGYGLGAAFLEAMDNAVARQFTKKKVSKKPPTTNAATEIASPRSPRDDFFSAQALAQEVLESSGIKAGDPNGGALFAQGLTRSISKEGMTAIPRGSKGIEVTIASSGRTFEFSVAGKGGTRLEQVVPINRSFFERGGTVTSPHARKPHRPIRIVTLPRLGERRR